MAEKISLYSNHSYAACIGEGFRFLAKHLLLVSKVMLPYYTVYSLLMVLSSAANIRVNVGTIAGDEITPQMVITAILLFVVAYVAHLIATGRLFLMLRRLTGAEISTPEEMAKEVTATKTAAWKTTIRRTLQLAYRSLPYSIWGLPVAYFGSAAAEAAMKRIMGLSQTYMIATLIAIAVFFIVAVVFAIPFIYTYYCRMMQPSYIDTTTEEGRRQKEAFGLKAAYRKAFRHKGKILGVTMLAMFLFAVASMVLLLPGFVSTEAYLSSVEGRVNFGDSVLIPTYGYVFMVVVSTVSYTLANILSVSVVASLMYLHGDIYSKEK